MDKEHKHSDLDAFDRIWSWLAGTTLSVSAIAFIFLSSGSSTLLPDADALRQDDAKVQVAYFSIIAISLGLSALGWIFRISQLQPSSKSNIGWPRLLPLEGKDRNPRIAKAALAVILLVALLGLLSSLNAYISKSRVSCWNARSSLAEGFFSSRLEAMSAGCTSGQMFRMHPIDDIEPFAPQWFSFSDFILLIATALAVYLWASIGIRSLHNTTATYKNQNPDKY